MSNYKVGQRVRILKDVKGINEGEVVVLDCKLFSNGVQEWSAILENEEFGCIISEEHFEPIKEDYTNDPANDYPVDWNKNLFRHLQGATQDNVNNPAHYGNGSIECIDYIEDFLNPDEFQGYLRGNIAKYLHRWPYKNGVEDLKKAQWYLNKLIETVEGKDG